MKVLFQSYNTSFQNTSGGVKNRMKKIFNLLKNKNIDVQFFYKFETNLNDFDILHIFMLDYENFNLIKKAKENNLKVIISTIIPLNNGFKIDLNRILFSKLPIYTNYKLMLKSAQMADLLIVETPGEKRFIEKHYKVNKNKIIVIPNGIDEDLEKYDEIYNYVDNNKKYILQVGRFDENKNQLNVIKALKNEDFDIVFIGGPGNNSDEYYNKCLNEAKNHDNVHFLGWIDSNSKVIKSAYQNAELIIVPSHYETFGMVILEAISANKKLAVSNTLPILEYDILNFGTFNPSNLKDIRNKTLDVYNSSSTNVNFEKVRGLFEWENIINKHIKCYEEIIDEKKA